MKLQSRFSKMQILRCLENEMLHQEEREKTAKPELKLRRKQTAEDIWRLHKIIADMDIEDKKAEKKEED